MPPTKEQKQQKQKQKQKRNARQRRQHILYYKKVAAEKAAAALRVELGALKVSELKKRARAAGVGQESLDTADDQEAPKAEVIELILLAAAEKAAEEKAAEEKAAEEKAPPDSSEGLTLNRYLMVDGHPEWGQWIHSPVLGYRWIYIHEATQNFVRWWDASKRVWVINTHEAVFDRFESN